MLLAPAFRRMSFLLRTVASKAAHESPLSPYNNDQRACPKAIKVGWASATPRTPRNVAM